MRLRRKLHSSRGETLIETLAAILIASLSVALLFTCIMASVRMDETARAADARYYAALSAAEKQETGMELVDADGNAIGAVVTVTGEGGAAAPPQATFQVGLYGGEDMYSYKAKEVTPVGP